MNDNNDLIDFSESTKNANGGTEQMTRALYSRLPRDLLKNFQIIPTRLSKELDETKIRIAYIHDLPGDPSLDYLKNKGWTKFHRLVFVSNWQMQQFIGYYQIPWSKCIVMKNAIMPIEEHKKEEELRLIYTPTPHRGLSILVGVFENLIKKYPNIHLDIFSSFKLYGWDDRDKEYQKLYDHCSTIPNINYHGTVSNDEVRMALQKAHIFAYPSIWMETSCLCLLEAMSANLICVHPNLAALYETAANHTVMYQFQEDLNRHAGMFYQCLDHVISHYEDSCGGLKFQKAYIDHFYNIETRALQWKAFLESLLEEPRQFEQLTYKYNTATGQIS